MPEEPCIRDQAPGRCLQTNRHAASVIAIGLSTGEVDRVEVADLRRRYEAIRADAAILDPRLRRVLRDITNPVAAGDEADIAVSGGGEAMRPWRFST